MTERYTLRQSVLSFFWTLRSGLSVLVKGSVSFPLGLFPVDLCKQKHSITHTYTISNLLRYQRRLASTYSTYIHKLLLHHQCPPRIPALSQKTRTLRPTEGRT